jgi:hypothetical protein
MLLAALLVLSAGCGRSRQLLTAPATAVRPALVSTLALAPAGAGRFTARLLVSAPEAGTRVFYALDPPATGEPAWLAAPANGLALTLARRDAAPYVLAVKSVAPDGSTSEVRRIEFTADNVVAQATIVSPHPTHSQPVSPPLRFTIRWTGTDPEAPNGVPGGYLTRLVTGLEIDPAYPSGVTQQRVMEYFAADLAAHRERWLETTATERTLDALTPQVVYYFAVAALDAGGEPGSVETLFNLDRNVLQFRPTLDALGPDLTVSSPYFYLHKFTALLDPTPRITVPLRAGQTLPVRWSAIPDVGTDVTGFRWALDLADLADESVRKSERDLEHWTEWSLATTSVTVGPFRPGDADKPVHLLYIEARDTFGNVNLFVVAIDVTRKPHKPVDLLVVDDMYGTPSDRNGDGFIPFKGTWPMEAEQDSFHFAVGGVPDVLHRVGVPGADPGALSLAGAFEGFAYDTLDYRFWPEVGISILDRYKAVAWYTDQNSAVRIGTKFGSISPATALREVNRIGRLNQLALYVASGGKVWLFGSGATTAIANGYWSRIASGAPRVPYTSGDDLLTNVLVPGNFLYDYVHLRSELMTAGTNVTSLTARQQLHAAIPHLPEFSGPASQTDRTHDPRIGPSAARTAQRWSGLPRLTIPPHRLAHANPAERSVNLTWVITKPLHVTEGTGRQAESVLDTLYLCQALDYDPEHLRVPASDGFPNAVHYHGSEHGEVVWFGFSLYEFELEQARQVVRLVMKNFGIEPLPAGTRQGAGTPVPPAFVGETAEVAVQRP